MVPLPPRRAPMPCVSRFAGAALLLWAATLLTVAGVNWEQPWALFALIPGVLIGALAVTGFVRHAMAGPLISALLLTALAMFAAGLVLVELAPAVAGVAILCIVGSAGAIIVAGREGGGAAASGGNLERALDALRAQIAVSDDVRRVLNRDHETGMLREAVHRDIEAGRLDEALAICQVLSAAYGLVAEAEEMRGRIIEAQQLRDADGVRSAIDGFEHLLQAFEWTAAHREAARIQRVFGGAYPLPDLGARLEAARLAHKDELERRFLETAQRDDAEGAMVLLKELDRYLSPAEAEGLAEVARGVVGRHRENLGVRFRLSVQDHRWGDAVDAGEAIIDEFPNTRMATEVRSVIDVLRQRARRGQPAQHPVV